MARAPKTTATQTTAQRLDSIVKSARKIMRKDKGLNGDLDRLPVLTWIMFLKFLDDLERMHQDEAELAGSAFASAIEPPYRWRDWAADKDGITGPDLLTFITAEKTMLPDSSEGPGLFAYLRALRGTNGGRDRRDVIATVFRGVTNRMESGYLLRDVINLINAIHFDSSEEMHTLGRLSSAPILTLPPTCCSSTPPARPGRLPIGNSLPPKAGASIPKPPHYSPPIWRTSAPGGTRGARTRAHGWWTARLSSSGMPVGRSSRSISTSRIPTPRSKTTTGRQARSLNRP
jgi:hypothetical protein